MPVHKQASLLRRTAIGIAAASAFLVGACGGETSGPDTGVSVQDVWADPAGLDGRQVTVSADVQQIVNEWAFTMSGVDDTGVDPLLVVHSGAAEVQPGAPVRVTGVVHRTLDPERVGAVDPPLLADIYDSYGPDPYLEASAVGPLPADGG
jgi:hypothetical protein